MKIHSALALLALAGGLRCANGCNQLARFDAGVDLFDSKTEVNHATGWSVTYKNFYKDVTVGGMKYQLVHCQGSSAEYAKAVAALPACGGSNCKRFTVPLESVAVLGNEVVGFLEELQLLDSVKVVGSAPLAPCLASEEKLKVAEELTDADLNNLDAVFVTKAGKSPTAKHIDMSAVHKENKPLAKLEWVEFVSLFYNAEGMANYVLYRSQQSYDMSSHIAKAQGPDSKKVMWVAGITDTKVIVTGDLYLDALAKDANVALSLFGEEVDKAGAGYVTAMKEADAIVVTDGKRYHDAEALLAALEIPMSDKSQYKALNYASAKDFKLYQADKFVSKLDEHDDHDHDHDHEEDEHLGNDWEEHAYAGPDILLSDLIKATRGGAPWDSAPWVYLRAAENKPIVVDVKKYCGKEVLGAARPSSLKQVRLAVMSGMTLASANPSAAITNYDSHTDYFPDKVDPLHAEDFDVEYHMTWKLLRDNRNKVFYVLQLKGVPANELPSEHVLSGAKRFNIPVTKVGFSETPTAPLIRMLGKMASVQIAGHTPDSCILKGLEDGTILNQNSPNTTDAHFEALDVWFGNPRGWQPRWPTTKTNAVGVESTSDPGPLKRAEWILFMSAFFNAEKLGEEIFGDMMAKYLCAGDKGKHASQLAGKTPSIVEISTSWSVSGGFSATRSKFTMMMMKAAGGDAASDNKTHPFYKEADTVASNELTFNSAEKLHAALKHVDVVIDGSWGGSSANAKNPPTLEDFLVKFKMSDMSATERDEFAFYRTGALYRYDKRMDGTASGYTDQFTRMVVEPDAAVLDFMGALHSSLKGSTPTYFLRNLLANDTVVEAVAEKCTDYTAAMEPLTKNEGKCELLCNERTTQAYCKLGCMWTADKTCVVAPQTEIPTPAPTLTPAPSDAASVAPAIGGLLMVGIAAML
eukprot:TRINITY_DN7862_c0_g1_i1.p1 TRINITY_DN7862_c0_g1~~TRINITY_DN7862_c0_g1_i1.p1  ORF type:complete len:920 (+),score=258.87 TRINITY_DN7862_c0_g1_i1:56-2815(+)